MKFKQLFLAGLVMSLLFSGATMAKNLDTVDWQAFSANLTNAMQSDNDGLKQSAMCMIIRYANYLDMPRSTVFDIVRVFRSHKNQNVRLLALVALHKIEDPWAMDYLRRHRTFEKQDRIRRMCQCCVTTYYAKQDSIKAAKTEEIVLQTTDELLQEFGADAEYVLNMQQYGF